jgi:hypothetical protein
MHLAVQRRVVSLELKNSELANVGIRVKRFTAFRGKMR